MPRLRATAALAAAALLLSGCAAVATGTVGDALCEAPRLSAAADEDVLVLPGDTVELTIEGLTAACNDTGTGGETPTPDPVRQVPVLWLQDDAQLEIAELAAGEDWRARAFTIAVPADAAPGIGTVHVEWQEVSFVVGDPDEGWDRALWPAPSLSLGFVPLDRPVEPGLVVELDIHDHLATTPDDAVAWDPLAPSLVPAAPAPIRWLQEGVDVELDPAPASVAALSRWRAEVPEEAVPGEARIVLGDSEVLLVVGEVGAP